MGIYCRVVTANTTVPIELLGADTEGHLAGKKTNPKEGGMCYTFKQIEFQDWSRQQQPHEIELQLEFFLRPVTATSYDAIESHNVQAYVIPLTMSCEHDASLLNQLEEQKQIVYQLQVI